MEKGLLWRNMDNMFLLHIVNKINFKWNKNICFKGKALKLLEENVEEYLYDPIGSISLKECKNHKGKDW